MAKEKELSNDDKFELLLQALVNQKTAGLSAEELKAILVETSQATASSMQRALKPENTHHPNISAFRPKGGPDPELPYECWYIGQPIHKSVETHTDRELELIQQVQPGEYTVIRNDHSPMAVSVTAERDAHGKITKLEILFPVPREDKPKIPPMQVMLFQLVHAGTGSPMNVYVRAMQDRLETIAASEMVSA